MKKKLMFISVIALLTCFHTNVMAQGKAPWTVTKNWIYEQNEDSDEGLYVDAWIYGKKAKGRCDDEPNTICNGGINVALGGKTLYYLVLNYVAKDAKGYIYNATMKSKDSPVFTGKLLVQVKGNASTGASLKISALTENLRKAHVNGITLIGTPTAMDE